MKTFTIERYSGKDPLKIAVLAFAQAEVVEVEPGQEFMVPISPFGETGIMFEGSVPTVIVSDDPENLVLSISKNAVLLADFASESKGQVRRKKKIFVSK